MRSDDKERDGSAFSKTQNLNFNSLIINFLIFLLKLSWTIVVANIIKI
jgi:hypothetical protein